MNRILGPSYRLTRRRGDYALITGHADCVDCESMIESSLAYNGPCILQRSDSTEHVGIAVRVRCDRRDDCLCPLCAVNVNWLLNEAVANVRVLLSAELLDEDSIAALNSDDGLIVDLAAGGLSAALWLCSNGSSRSVYGFSADVETTQPL